MSDFLLRVCVLGVCVVSAASCSSGGNDTAPAPASSAPVATSGPQRVTGTAPPAANGFPAFIVLDPVEGAAATPQATVPTMDQVQQTFTPAILFVRTGQPVEFTNNDEVLHNIRVRNEATKSSAFNISIPNGDKFRFVFNEDGFYDVGCDIHPAMSAQIFSTTSPYAVTAADNAQFVIENVPMGKYKATVYAGAAKIEREVTVQAGQAPLDLSHP
jgi:plastocyanin